MIFARQKHLLDASAKGDVSASPSSTDDKLLFVLGVRRRLLTRRKICYWPDWTRADALLLCLGDRYAWPDTLRKIGHATRIVGRLRLMYQCCIE